MMAGKIKKFPRKTGAALTEEEKEDPVRPAALAKPAEDWFDDRQTLVRSEGGHDDGESIWLISYADMMTLLFGFFVLVSSFSKIDVDSFEKVRKESTQLFGGDYKKAHQPLQEDLKEDVQLQGMTDKAVFEEMDKGIAIVFRGSLFFDSGSAEIKPQALELLAKVIPTIKKQQHRFNVVVEGHTDDNSISNERFPSNWELSSQRASAVLRVFEAAGFERTQLRAIGFADTQPIVPNRAGDGNAIPDNQSHNRRVVIKLVRANRLN